MRRFCSTHILGIIAVSFLLSVFTNEEAPKALEPAAIDPLTKIKDRPVIVAVIDTGADIEHTFIKNYLWSNPGETGLDSQGRDKSSNGFDDDTNGFVDDVHGWNFITANNDLKDNHGHGTHIGGIITQELTNPIQVQLMILKYYEDQSSEFTTLQASNRAIRYALDMGADIINYSGGGDLPSPIEKELFRAAEKSNVLVVAASGNDGRSTDNKGFYPASYGFKNIISVASTNPAGELLPSSNRGIHSVDLAARGSEVVSSLPYQRIGALTGTSQATAKVTGIIASIMAQSPMLSLNEVKTRVIQTAKSMPSLYGLIKNPKIPNLERALRMRDQNEFNEKWKLTMSKVQEIFDEPLTADPEREVSSQRLDYD